MPKYLVLYRGDVLPAAEMPVDENDEVMERWGAWMERNGDLVDDPGFPFGERGAIGGDGSEQPTSKMSGYSIIHADSLAAAMKRCRDHPFLDDVDADYAVEIYELLPI